MAVKVSRTRATSRKNKSRALVFHASGDMLSCKFCQHGVDEKRVDTCKDHLWSKDYEKTR